MAGLELVRKLHAAAEKLEKAANAVAREGMRVVEIDSERCVARIGDAEVHLDAPVVVVGEISVVARRQPLQPAVGLEEALESYDAYIGDARLDPYDGYSKLVLAAHRLLAVLYGELSRLYVPAPGAWAGLCHEPREGDPRSQQLP